MTYSIFQLARNALNYGDKWERAWRQVTPQSAYDLVIIGGGGHGLATAYYLASRYKVGKICVLEKGWLGGGNTARNTTVIRSNYLQPASMRIYDHAMDLWSNLSQSLNFNVMYSPRGLIHLAHNQHDLKEIARRGSSNYAQGIPAKMLSPQEIKEMVPIINLHSRFPVLAGLFQENGGIARHDAVAWGFARAADQLGVDIIQNCEVTGFNINEGKLEGIRTTQGDISCSRAGMVVAGNCSRLANLAGFRLPIETVPLQAFVSEPLAPVLDYVTMSNTVHFYISQSNKGELVIGGGSDAFNSYMQRGSFDHIEQVAKSVVELYPILRRVKMLRQWAGIVDISVDRSPIIGPTPVSGLFINCGWGTGGFKTTPGSGSLFAKVLATGAHTDMSAPVGLERFTSGALVDEAAAAAVAH